VEAVLTAAENRVPYTGAVIDGKPGGKERVTAIFGSARLAASRAADDVARSALFAAQTVAMELDRAVQAAEASTVRAIQDIAFAVLPERANDDADTWADAPSDSDVSHSLTLKPSRMSSSIFNPKSALRQAKSRAQQTVRYVRKQAAAELRGATAWANRSKPKGKGPRARPGRQSGGATGSSAPAATIARRSPGAMASLYRSALTDPWFNQPVRLGVNTFTPTSLKTATYRNTFTATGGATGITILATPAINLAPSGLAPSEFGFNSVYAYNGTGASLALDLTSANTSPAAGASQFVNDATTARVVAGALRVTVRYAATSIRGSVQGIWFPAVSVADIVQNSPIGLGNLAAARTAYSDAGGELTLEVQYRPYDPSCFFFSSQLVANGGIDRNFPLNSVMAVVITGFPANAFTVEVDQIYHYETMGSSLAGNNDEAHAESLALAGLTVDQIGHIAITSGEPVVCDQAALRKLDSKSLAYLAGAGGGTAGLGELNGMRLPSHGTNADMVIVDEHGSSRDHAVSAPGALPRKP
jgi:hypothetical protein